MRKRIHTRQMDAAPAPTTRELGGAFLPLGKHTSTRCRATHDVPWSERCVLDERHQMRLLVTELGTIQEPHKDKKGNRW